jgi:hypothetical protein
MITEYGTTAKSPFADDSVFIGFSTAFSGYLYTLANTCEDFMKKS